MDEELPPEIQAMLADPEQAEKLMNLLPDVRDGLNRQQRNLLFTMHKLALTHDAHPGLTARICGWADDWSLPKKRKPEVKMKLKEFRVTEEGTEEYYTPDLF